MSNRVRPINSMLALVFFALFLLAALNYYLGRSFFYPAFAYCAVWTLALLCLLVSGDMFFPLSAETLSIFMWGAVAFTVGSAAGRFFPLSISSAAAPKEPRKIISLLLAVLIVAFPFYLLWLLGLISEHPADFFLQSTRNSFVDLMDAGQEKYTLKYVLFINLLGFAPMLAVVAWMERKGRTKRALLAVLVALFYHLLTGARATIIQFLLSLLCVEWFMVRRIKFRLLAAVGVSIIVIFGVLAVFVHGSSPVDEMAGYVGGPLVAFDRVVKEPRIIPHVPNAASFFVETASKLGMKVEVPTRVTQFVPTGPDRNDNVFTIYFNYFDAGMIMACLCIAVEAFFLALIYRSALSGNKVAIIVYAYLFSCIVLTTFSDYLMGGINPLLKITVLAWMLYAFPMLKSRFAVHMKRSAECTPC